ncbi:hypothetical protein [Candidatus Amarobacter glycogenicus]|uniref:hypothetical protein n=1 Tax=Candidatus Amarobacter glycogenicus TaxID=3140699 RepID=UPI003135FA80|nr:hypothetical protein [Dehalococcoidia bacterium]MBK9341738.1 hypothetical protein [Dehalococcoidia bacterium]
MMFPKDRTLYANLNTSFTSFDALIADLKERKLTGYIEITAPAYTGTLLLSEGEVVNAQELSGDKRTVGPEAARGVMERAAQKDGVINVYSAFPDVVLLLHRLMDSRPLYRDLTSAFTSLDRLISKLRSDGLTGYVEVHIGENEGAGIIYLAGGEPVESVFSSGGQMTNGQEALNAIVSTVNTSGGTFNVFVEAGDGSAAGAGAAPPAKPQEDFRSELLAFWDDVISITESTVDGFAKPGRFLMAFREVLVSRAVTYPFLDPFAAEFSYAGGHISFDHPLPDDFNKALGDCLSDAVSKLAFQFKRADLETRVRSRLDGISEKHAAIIDRFGLRDDVQEFVA